MKKLFLGVACILTAIALMACGKGAGIAAPDGGSLSVTSGSVTSGIEEPGETTDNAPSGDIVDFDGDGAADTATVQAADTDHALLTVTLGNGTVLKKEFPGWWWPVDAAGDIPEAGGEPVDIQCADINGDGKSDMLIVLQYGGGSGLDSNVHILCVADGQLTEYSINYDFTDSTAGNAAFFENINTACWGAWFVREGESVLLRTRHWNADADNSDSAWYIDSVWSGEAWDVQRVVTGAAYSYELDIQ